MKHIATKPKEAKSWKYLALGWLVIPVLLLVGLMFITDMPNQSYSGPFNPLIASEITIRDRLQSHVSMIAGTIGERNIWHYLKLKAAENYIRDTFMELGYSVEEQSFDSEGREVKNLLAELPGNSNPEEIIVIGAHYDSVADSSGADDNSTGIAALLELARLLEQQKLPRTVRFVAFVNEEQPFFQTETMGSLVNATQSQKRGEQIVAMLSLETIGYYSEELDSQRYPFPFSFYYPSKGNFIGFVGNLGSRALVRQAIDSFRQHTEFPSEGVAAPSWIHGIGLSDHWAFWEAGYAAIMITDTAPFRYPYYHSLGDTPDKIDYPKTARVVNGIAKVIMVLTRISKDKI